MRLLAVLLLSVQLSGDGRHQVFRRCSACLADCRASGSGRECLDACYRMKAADCRQNGHGPGPRRTCDCT